MYLYFLAGVPKKNAGTEQILKRAGLNYVFGGLKLFGEVLFSLFRLIYDVVPIRNVFPLLPFVAIVYLIIIMKLLNLIKNFC